MHDEKCKMAPSQVPVAPKQPLNDTAEELLNRIETARTTASCIENRLYGDGQANGSDTISCQPYNLQDRLEKASDDMLQLCKTLECIREKI